MAGATKSSYKAVLRAAKVADVERVQGFYDKHPHKNILGRAEAVRQACARGRQFIVEVDGEIIAASGCYPVGETSYLEAGGTRVADAWNGFELQGLFIWARIAAVALTERDAQITTAVDGDNPRSLVHVERHRFEPWTTPAPDLLSECDSAEGRAGCAKKAALPAGSICCCQFYLLSRAALRQEVADFLAATSASLDVERARKDGSAVLVVHIACASVASSEQREILAAIAGGE